MKKEAVMFNPLTEKVIDILTERSLEKVLGKTVGAGAMWGLMAIEVFEYEVDEHQEALLEKAGTVLDNCHHLRIIKPGFSHSGAMCDYLTQFQGCAFIYDSVFLWHPTYNLDVKRLSSRVLRYSPEDGQLSYHCNSPLSPCCPICHPPRYTPIGKTAAPSRPSKTRVASHARLITAPTGQIRVIGLR